MSPALRPLRKREEMPDFVREALERSGLRAAYDARPTSATTICSGSTR